jgi:transposase-like protein
MKQLTVIRYSNSFKQHVIRELEDGRFDSVYQLREHYGIKGATTIPSWLRKYGKNHLCRKVVRVEMPNEQDEIRRLKKEIKQLKQALGQTQAENVLNQAFLEMACDELGQQVDEFKKKADTGLSRLPEEKQD